MHGIIWGQAVITYISGKICRLWVWVLCFYFNRKCSETQIRAKSKTYILYVATSLGPRPYQLICEVYLLTLPGPCSVCHYNIRNTLTTCKRKFYLLATVGEATMSRTSNLTSFSLDARECGRCLATACATLLTHLHRTVVAESLIAKHASSWRGGCARAIRLFWI